MAVCVRVSVHTSVSYSVCTVRVNVVLYKSRDRVFSLIGMDIYIFFIFTKRKKKQPHQLGSLLKTGKARKNDIEKKSTSWFLKLREEEGERSFPSGPCGRRHVLLLASTLRYVHD